MIFTLHYRQKIVIFSLILIFINFIPKFKNKPVSFFSKTLLLGDGEHQIIDLLVYT